MLNTDKDKDEEKEKEENINEDSLVLSNVMNPIQDTNQKFRSNIDIDNELGKNKEKSNIEKIGMVVEDQFEQKSVPNVIADSFFKSEEDKKKFNELSFFRIGNNFRTYWPHDTASQEFKIPALYLNEW